MSDDERRDGGADGNDADDEPDPIIGGENGGGEDGGGEDGGDGAAERVREAAPDTAEEAADEVSRSVLAVEKTVLIASVVITVLLLGFLAYSAVTTPETAPPGAEVVGATPTGNGTDLVRVGVTNYGARGLESVTVGVECGEVSTDLAFDNVPATNTATGVVVCPAGAERNLTIRSWQVA